MMLARACEIALNVMRIVAGLKFFVSHNAGAATRVSLLAASLCVAARS
jgi:hypothetical protein